MSDTTPATHPNVAYVENEDEGTSEPVDESHLPNWWGEATEEEPAPVEEGS